MFHVIITTGDDLTTRSLAAIHTYFLITHYTHYTHSLYTKQSNLAIMFRNFFAQVKRTTAAELILIFN